MTGQATDEQLLASSVSLALFDSIIACQSPDQLDAVARLIWERYGAGAVNDDEASYLTSCIERRRPLSRRTSTGKFATVSKMNGRISRFMPRQRQRSPDRKASRDRRRMLGGSSALPDCAYRRRRPRCPAHGDHVIRSMTTRAAHELDGAVGFIF